MSGPKYYSFYAPDAEEAAEILSRFSGFQPGVSAKIQDGKINFVVSNKAWLEGVDYDAIKQKLNEAKKSYYADEKILKSSKTKECERIKKIKNIIEIKCRNKKKQLDDANNLCNQLKKEVKKNYTTPFGIFTIGEYEEIIENVQTKIKIECDNLENEKSICCKNCDENMKEVENCKSLHELNVVLKQEKVMDIGRFFLLDRVEQYKEEIDVKQKKIENYVQFLNKLNKLIKEKDLTDYKDEINNIVKKEDKYSQEAMNNILEGIHQIENEHVYKKEKAILEKANQEALEKVRIEEKMLSELTNELKPLIINASVNSKTKVDYEKMGKDIIAKGNSIFNELENLSFCSSSNYHEINELKESFDNYCKFLNSPSVYQRLKNEMVKLEQLKAVCLHDAKNYEIFTEEVEKYKNLYIKFDGMYGSKMDKSEDKENFIEEPTEIVFAYLDQEKQISFLKERNIQLEKVIQESTNRFFCMSVSAILKEKNFGSEFKREINFENGKNTSLSFVRPDSKGAIYDIGLQDGKIGIVPKGVILSNGRSTINKDGLKQIYSSCKWADDLNQAFIKMGNKYSNYEEMGKEISEKYYDEANFYHIETEEESIRFLKMSGFSDEEIRNYGYKIRSTLDKKEESRKETEQHARELKPDYASR